MPSREVGDWSRMLERFDIEENEFIEMIDETLMEDFSKISQEYQKEIRKFKEEEIERELKALEVASTSWVK